jgi:hypothetical protein
MLHFVNAYHAMEEIAMRRCCAILAASFVCFLQGCIPGVSWLPDSSGFVFTTPKGRLVVYDLPTRKHRVILQDSTAATTCLPAISPSGKRIALGHLHDSHDKITALLQFVVCDVQGKIEFRSDKILLAPLKGKDFGYTTQIVWSPDEKKLLVHGQGNANQGKGFNIAGLFDITTGKIQVWDEHVPAFFGGTPIRPDGAGFLLGKLQSNDDIGEYAWVDWNGKEKRIAITQREAEPEPIPPYTALCDSRWDGAKAVLTLPQQRYVIDTEKLEQMMLPVREADTMIGKEFIRMRTKLANGLELLLLERDDGGKDGSATRVVARKPGDTALTEILSTIRDCMVQLGPSPNGKHAIVRVAYGYRGSKGDTIYVLSDVGRVLDTIHVCGEFGEE